ncbi:MAG: NAD(P)(+) transhydrogenase (Re/Si-specific) subunit alpha, partial [Alphaproteobacteria bacterium]
MKIAIPKERRAHETRVAASPATVKKLVGLGCEVVLEKGAGLAASYADSAYKEAGATIAKDAATALSGAAVVFKVQRPIAGGKDDELKHLPSGAVVVGLMDPYRARDDMLALAKA